jgi:hypothetical protein
LVDAKIDQQGIETFKLEPVSEKIADDKDHGSDKKDDCKVSEGSFHYSMPLGLILKFTFFGYQFKWLISSSFSSLIESVSAMYSIWFRCWVSISLSVFVSNSWEWLKKLIMYAMTVKQIRIMIIFFTGHRCLSVC